MSKQSLTFALPQLANYRLKMHLRFAKSSFTTSDPAKRFVKITEFACHLLLLDDLHKLYANDV
jgi:hypothetical protein